MAIRWGVTFIPASRQRTIISFTIFRTAAGVRSTNGEQYSAENDSSTGQVRRGSMRHGRIEHGQVLGLERTGKGDHGQADPLPAAGTWGFIHEGAHVRIP